MNHDSNGVELVSHIEDPQSIRILMCLLDGKSLPISDLARFAHISPRKVSSHVKTLLECGVVVQEMYGAHQYYRLANTNISKALEALYTTPLPKTDCPSMKSVHANPLQFARTCYGHIAGKVGVALTDKFLELGYLEKDGRDFVITKEGTKWFLEFGISADELKTGHPHFARQCLDWTERRHHIAGSLGIAITNQLFERGWIERISGERAVQVTNAGHKGLEELLGISLRESRTKITQE